VSDKLRGKKPAGAGRLGQGVFGLHVVGSDPRSWRFCRTLLEVVPHDITPRLQGENF
jgi:hypothetical protein